MACPLCGCDELETVSRKDRRGSDLDTILCTRCGIVAHARIPEDAELRQYYERDYRLDYHGELTPSPHRVLRAWNNGQRIVQQLQPHLPAVGDVFEIGAGIGCTVKAFERAGYRARGIEPNRGFLAYSREQLGTQVEVGEWTDLAPVPAFDIVLLIHVIEHLRDPLRALSHLHRLLRVGGHFYVECPNFAAPHAAPGNQFHYAHLFNFTPSTLQMVAEACGFDLVRRFGSESDPNLQMLFRKGTPRELTVDPAAVGQARRALSYHWFSYHLRPGYLVERVRKLSQYAWERLTASRRVRQLVAECRRGTALDATSAPRRAA